MNAANGREKALCVVGPQEGIGVSVPSAHIVLFPATAQMRPTGGFGRLPKRLITGRGLSPQAVFHLGYRSLHAGSGWGCNPVKMTTAVRRGYSLGVFKRTIKELKEAGLYEREQGKRKKPGRGRGYAVDHLTFEAPETAKRQSMVMDQEGAAVRISAKDRRSIEALGGDVDELYDRAMTQKAKGRRIGSVVRYMIQCAKNDAATQLGTDLGVVQEIITGNRHARQAALATATGGNLAELRRDRARMGSQRSDGAAPLAALERSPTGASAMTGGGTRNRRGAISTTRDCEMKHACE